MNIYSVILAAGQGSRFGGKIRKQFLQIDGVELWKILYNTISKIVPIDNIVVVGVDIQGGSTRSKSVQLGLEWVRNRGVCDKVLICEAARPLVTEEQISSIINSESDSCAFYRPVVDTVIVDGCTYIDRQQCKHIVSPQAFDFQKLYLAYSNYGESITRTDDTQLMYEVYGIIPELLLGGENLYKVTYPRDLEILKELVVR